MYVTTRRSGDTYGTGLQRLNSILGEAFGMWPQPGNGDAITSAWVPPATSSRTRRRSASSWKCRA
jgi:hypothetical protein